MATATSRSHPHWNYLLALDSDLAQLARYIEFDRRNFDCFSLELARVLLAAASEVDVVAKQLCRDVKGSSRADSIGSYRDEIVPAYPEIPDFKVTLPRYGITLQPWDEWRKPVDNVPPWWTACNKVKHERHDYYERASLKNALDAVGGLLVLVLYLCKDEAAAGGLAPSPQTLRAHDDHLDGVTVGDYDAAICYRL